ncbi:hypothetical protein M8J77_019486 [Diaphorina citri]|nr:hypothetical protein M8J77_019486 [Diaphorina citri]
MSSLISMMRPNVKFLSGGKIVGQSDLRVPTALGHDSLLTVLQWNAGGITTSKRTELHKILVENDVDMFCIMEANLTNENLNFNMSGYTLHILPKSRQIASGILIGIKTNLMATFSILKEMNINDKIEITKTDIWKNNEHFKVYSCYNPPNNSPDMSILNIEPKTIIIGDLNSHSPRWGYQDQNAPGKIIEDFIDTNTVELVYHHTDTPTFLHYCGSSTNPDLLLVSSDIAEYTERMVREDPGSGHRMILAKVKLKNNRENVEKNTIRTTWNFKKAEWKNYKNHLEEQMEQISLTSFTSPDSLNKEITKIILQIAKKFIPRGKVKKFKPFWTKNLAKLKSERNKARRKAERVKSKESVIEWRKKAAEFIKELNTSKRSAFDNFIERMDYRKDGTKAYSFISNIYKKKTINKKPFSHNGKLITNERKIASLFNTQYTSKYLIPPKYKKEERKIKREIKNSNLKANTLPISTKETFSKNFNLTELNQAIKKLRNKAAPGIDKIHPEFLKNMGPKAKSRLLDLYNFSWKKSVPAEWRKAEIIPILKEGKPEECISSYRPISLTSHLAKVMERMVSSRLNWFLESSHSLSSSQAGFRKHRSTNEQVIRLSQDIKDNFNKKETTIAVFVDFQGAYDTIWRCKLFEKMSKMGIAGNMFQWIRNFITQRFCATRYENVTSGYKQTKAGLPQGAVLSTTLFNIFINDLLIKLEKTGVNVAAFADDIVIWSSQRKQKIGCLKNKIESALKVLKKWCAENLMIINEDKTKYQVFSLARKMEPIKIKYNNKYLKEADESKYLGITFDRKINWNKHVENTTHKARNRFKLLKRLAGTKWGCSRKTLNTTYNSYIKPTLTYCGEILITANETNKTKYERVQNEALRLITGAVKTTPINAMYALTNTKPIMKTLEEQALIQFEKIARLPTSKSWIHNEKSNTLKTQSGFIQKVAEIKNSFNIPSKIEHLNLVINPTESFEIDHSLTIEDNFRKQDVAPSVAKVKALEVINTKYPLDQWLHIFTDGSMQNPDDGAGAGISCDLFSFYKGLGPCTTNFDGEVEAIKIAVQQLLYRTNLFSRAVILSDSKAAIQSIANMGDSPTKETYDIYQMIKQLKSLNKQIAFQWIPAHCGIHELVQSSIAAGYDSRIKCCGTHWGIKGVDALIFVHFALRAWETDIFLETLGKLLNGVSHCKRHPTNYLNKVEGCTEDQQST